MAKKITVESDISLDKVWEELEERVVDTALLFKQTAQDDCPIRSGYMQSTIDASINEENPLTFDLTVGADYAPYTEYRTQWFSRAIDKASKKAGELWKN